MLSEIDQQCWKFMVRYAREWEGLKSSPSLHGEEKFGCGWRRICAFISLNAFSWLYAYVSKNVEHINALTLIFISLNSAIIKICHKNTLR